MTNGVLDVDFPVARPRLKGGGSQVDVLLHCLKCKRKEKCVISIKCFGEKRMFGCKGCGYQLELEVHPQRMSHI